jgi:hypothetical protein
VTPARPDGGAAVTGADRPPAAEPPGPEPRQRWRITYAREPLEADQVGRAALDAWTAALAASGLPVVMTEGGGGGRARLSFGAPLPAACAGRAELVDCWMLEPIPRWRLREALADRMPTGHAFVDAENVWLGAPPLPGQVVGAEWRVALTIPPRVEPRIRTACADLLAAPSIPRVRDKGGTAKPYDLRSLLTDVRFESGSGPALVIATRLDPALGTGRPEEVVAAVADAAALQIAHGSMVRERLVLAEPKAQPERPAGAAGLRRPSRRS